MCVTAICPFAHDVQIGRLRSVDIFAGTQTMLRFCVDHYIKKNEKKKKMVKSRSEYVRSFTLLLLFKRRMVNNGHFEFALH